MMAVWHTGVIDSSYLRKNGQPKIGFLLRPLDAERVCLDDPVIAFPV
jgi:hypothetical protein